MAAHPSLASAWRSCHALSRLDTFVIGYCDDARALLGHLDAEAPGRAARVRVLDADPLIACALRDDGLNAETVDLWSEAALRAAGLPDATTIVVFAERVRGSIELFEHVLRTVCPAAQILVVRSGRRRRALQRALSAPGLRIVLSWRFWALVGITVVDGLTFMVPLTALSLVTVALVKPRWLHAAARFFDDLAEAR